MSKTKGFSLIEILIALVIFAIVGSICAITLQMSLKTEERLKIASNDLSTLQFCYALINQDLTYLSSESARSFNATDKLLQFIRHSPFESSEEKASEQRQISYRMEEDTLTRSSQNLMGFDKEKRTLLRNLKAMEISYLNMDHHFTKEWKKNEPPHLIQFNIHLKEGTSLVWLFKVINNEKFSIR